MNGQTCKVAIGWTLHPFGVARVLSDVRDCQLVNRAPECVQFVQEQRSTARKKS